MKTYKILFALFAFTCFMACNTDDGNDIPPIEITETSITLDEYKGDVITIPNVLVTVKDEDGFAINNATVTIAGATYNTDDKGLAMINNANAYSNFLTVSAAKANYLTNFKTINPTESHSQVIDIILLKHEINGSFDGSASSASVNANNSQAKVEFTGGIVNETGNTYSGNVNVSVKHLSPDNEATFTTMPGALLAENNEESVMQLETYGMLGIELTGTNGEKLNITEANPATLTFPIAPDQAIIAPETIPLWYFNEDKGIWVEEGEATKVGNNYVGTVNHFSWWNCDVPINLVTFCLTIKDIEGNILPNQDLEIIRKLTGQAIFYGKTDSNGQLCGSIPKNEQVTITVFSEELSCLDHGELFSDDFGSYNSDGNNIDIVIDTNSLDVIDYTITGNFNGCNESSENNVVEISHQEKVQYIFTDTNGDFIYTYKGCEGEQIKIAGYDISSGEVTPKEAVIFDANHNANVSIGNTACVEFSAVYTGNVIIESQEELENFTAIPYTKIEGSLSLSNCTDLSSLNHLQEVTNWLQTSDNPLLPNFHGLEGIKSTKILSILGCPLITNLSGLENLSIKEEGGLAIFANFLLTDISALSTTLPSTLQFLEIGDNESLESLNGLENVTTIKEACVIGYNSSLKSLSGLDNLTSVLGENDGWLAIFDNQSLTNITALQNLTTIGGGGIEVYNNSSLISLSGLEGLTSSNETIHIAYNDLLTDLSGLNNITSITGSLIITGNDSITSLSGLENLTSIDGNLSLGILTYSNGTINNSGNILLTDYCAIKNITIGGDYNVANNAYNPTLEQLKSDAECSQ